MNVEGPAIQFQQVSKRFKLNASRPRSFLEVVTRRSIGLNSDEFWALRDVSFEIKPGETVGLIGPNGAGKSTILKLISRIIHPSGGKVMSRGRIASLLELGAGFHPDLSGRENIFLNASILGISRPAIKRQVDDIIDFAQIGPFIDTPVRNYSSGMTMRLGFAITTMLDPEVLLIDEILAVGDHSFQRKCLDRLDALRARGVTTVFVSHSLEQVQRLCPRAIWMSNGQVRADGESESVIGMYLDEAGASDMRRYKPVAPAGVEGLNRWGTYEAEITAVELLDKEDRLQKVFVTGGVFHLRIHYRTQEPIIQPAFGMAFYRRDGLHLNGPNSMLEGLNIPIIDGRGYVDYIVEQLPLAPDCYDLSVSIYSGDCMTAYDHHHRLYTFEVRDQRAQREDGVVHIPAVWRHVSGA
jgi:ABC-type polysaccharide/polyol phosphate transport system ATPase subunit